MFLLLHPFFLFPLIFSMMTVTSHLMHASSLRICTVSFFLLQLTFSISPPVRLRSGQHPASTLEQSIFLLVFRLRLSLFSSTFSSLPFLVWFSPAPRLPLFATSSLRQLLSPPTLLSSLHTHAKLLSPPYTTFHFTLLLWFWHFEGFLKKNFEFIKTSRFNKGELHEQKRYFSYKHTSY